MYVHNDLSQQETTWSLLHVQAVSGLRIQLWVGTSSENPACDVIVHGVYENDDVIIL